MFRPPTALVTNGYIGATNSEATPSRRRFFLLAGGLSAAAAVSGPALAALPSTCPGGQVDPTFALIEEHLRLCDWVNEDYDDELFADIDEELDRRSAIEIERQWQVVENEPTTIAGVVRLLEHVAQLENKSVLNDGAMLTAVMSTVVALRDIANLPGEAEFGSEEAS